MKFIDLLEFSGEAASRRSLYTGALLISLFCVTSLTTYQFFQGSVSPWYDFQYLYTVGHLTWSGQAADAYSALRFKEIVEARGGHNIVPWLYPPPYDLLAALLSVLPLSLAYALYINIGLLAYYLTLRKIAGAYTVTALLLCFPGMLLNARTGQNGFITGTLIGWCAALMLRDSPMAGVPLGLMLIKPHLAVAPATYAVFDKRWKVVSTAFFVAASFILITTVSLGPGVWLDYPAGLKQVQASMVLDFESLACMPTLYAAMRTLRFSPEIAVTGQLIFSLIVISSIYAATRLFPKRLALGLSLAGSLTIGPYSMGYDIPIIGIALGLVLPDVIRLGRVRERLLIYLLIWFAGASELVRLATLGRNSESEYLVIFSITGFCLPLMYSMLWIILLRDREFRDGATVFGQI
jgi:Glycosyltransferase family 87